MKITTTIKNTAPHKKMAAFNRKQGNDNALQLGAELQRPFITETHKHSSFVFNPLLTRGPYNRFPLDECSMSHYGFAMGI